jgi:hypothetical protein
MLQNALLQLLGRRRGSPSAPCHELAPFEAVVGDEEMLDLVEEGEGRSSDRAAGRILAFAARSADRSE